MIAGPGGHLTLRVREPGAGRWAEEVVLGSDGHLLRARETKVEHGLERIDRAALSIRWSAERREVRDEAYGEVTPEDSARRIERALREELGLGLAPAAGMGWSGLAEKE